MTANASSSSATSRLELDLAGSGLLPPLPAALLEGRDRDLLSPLRFLAPGELPEGGPAEGSRTDLAPALATANAGYGHPRAAELAERLADPETRVVVTGQQPGFYGGPLLTLTKMMAAVRWAEAIEERSGSPAVAVFWVATEDHDWEEVSRAVLLPEDEPETFGLGDDPAPLMPSGMRTLGPALPELERRLREAQTSPESKERLEFLGRWYRPEARFGEAFCRLMVHLLGERSPLLFDAMLPAAKELQRPWLRRLVERRQEVEQAFQDADQRIEVRGHPLQVAPQRGVSPLFLLHGVERRRIEWRGPDRFALRGVEGSEAPVEELLETLEENPSVVSAGVLARPVVQDALFGTTLQLLGPSEMAYMAQVAPLYELLGVDAPGTTLRPQLLLLAEREAGYLEELDVPLGELLSREPEEVVAARKGENVAEEARREVKEIVSALGDEIRELDPNLERPWEKTRDHVDRALEQLASKVSSAIARRHDVWLRRMERLRSTCLPGGELQERTLSVAHFLALYGPGFARELADRFELDGGKLQAVAL